MMLGVPGWTVATFRDYYVPDQLAYLAIATDWSKGSTAAVEPFAETGSIYYPRLYYQFLGVVARVTGISAPTSWTLVGLAVQMVLVGMIGLTAVLLTRRAWAGLLAFVPFLVGTLANVRGGGDTWYVQEGFHARLWGTFASIFTLNGDNAAMTLGISSLLVLILVVARRIRGRAAPIAALAACFVIGGLSAVQTYSFLTVSYVLAATAAGWGLYHAHHKRWWVAATVLLGALLFLVGPRLVGVTGPLVLLVLAMTPALPGIVALWRQQGRIVLFAVVLYGVGAAPQVLITLSGVLGGDAFLSFRQGNDNDLSVPFVSGLVSALPVLLPLLWVLAAGIRRREALWVVVPAGGICAWFVAASNNVWGANQEPYRMWLNCFALMMALGLPLLLWVGVTYLARNRTLVGAAAVSVLVVFGLAFPDFLHWRSEVTRGGFVAFDTPQLTAAVRAAEPALAQGGLLLAGPCLDPLTLKPAWTGPIAYFNRGLAWPDHEREIRVLDAGMKVGLWSPTLAATAQVRWLLIDTSCSYTTQPAPVLVGATLANRSDTVQLWRLPVS